MNQTWRAFAKVNRDLRVLGRRPDGYHEIRSVIQTIDLHDEIRVSGSDAFRFSTTDGPADESNLVVRAVRAFEEETSTRVRLRLDLNKRIPAGAGLGGGSADAAVTLLGLVRTYRRPIPGGRLSDMLRTLGSDVPVFAVGGRVLATGRGEVVFPLPDAGETATRCFVLVDPGFRVATGEAYSWLTETPESTTILGFCACFDPTLGDAQPTPDARLNDFEAALFPRFPELADIKRRLWEAGALSAALTGSGSWLFGEFAGRSEAGRAAEVLGGAYAVQLVKPLPRAEYVQRVFGE